MSKAIAGCAQAKLPTEFGEFRIIAFDTSDDLHHAALIKGEIKDDMLVRIHSECLTGDVFHSQRCDCRAQLEAAVKEIEKEGNGAIIYLRQEGRGIGLYNKIKAYELQEQGKDTVEANVELGFHPDQRDYSIAGEIMKKMGIASVKLLTNNPEKIEAVEKCGIKVSKRVPIVVNSNTHNKKYLETKEEKMGHLLKN